MITSLGIGSGLDLEALVNDLVGAAAIGPANLLNRKEAALQADLSGLGLLSSALAEFGSRLTSLNKEQGLIGSTAASDNSELLTASAAAAADPGSYEVEVLALAKAHKLISAGYADADSEVGTGTLTLISGTTAFEVTVDAGNNSLAGLRDAINAATDGVGVTAGIVNVDDGFGGTVAKLTLTAVETGSDSAISVVVNDDDGNDTDTAGLSAFAFQAVGTQNLTESQAAVDAQISLDGQTVTRSSNTIGDAVTGLTLNLVQAEPGTTITLTVNRDSAGLKAQVTAFVEAYNSLVQTLSDLQAFDQQTGEAGLLLGDATLRSVDRQLRNLLLDTGFSAELDSLAAIGIGFAAGGQLEIEEEQLDAALENSLDSFPAFFAGDTGLASRLSALVNDYVDGDGSIEARTAGIESSLSRIEDRRDALDRRLTSLESRLRAQFSTMDAVVAQLTATSDFLADQLANLPGNRFLNDNR